MGKSKIGFHYSSGGNKTGIGDLITKLNQNGIPILLKGTDDAGLCFEGQTKGQAHGVDNHLIYRVSTTGQPDNIEYDVPDYTKSPLAAATEHFNKTAAKWPIELYREIVWMEPINEPRAKLNPGDVQWENMHPVDWLGLFMLEYAKIANGQGFKVCGPSFNSGEPEVFGTNDYELPGMLAYLKYCAENPEKAALSIHEYSWDRWKHGESWPNWYPGLWGRVEAAIAAADKNDTPRAFPIFVTEWGFAHNNAPRWPECEPHLTAYNEWAARWPMVKGVAAWTLSDGWGDVDLDLQSWFGPLGDYAVGADFPEGPQPAKTHIDFGGTTPGDIPMDTWQEQAAKIADDTQALAYKKGASLQTIPTSQGYQVFGNEFDFVRPDGVTIRMRGAIHPMTAVRRYYWVVIPNWSDVQWYELAAAPTPFEFKFYPVEGETLYVTSHFNAPRPQFPPTTNQKHEGIDLRAATGKRVVSVAAGVVDGIRTVDPGTGYGLYVRVKHNDRYLTWYGHMQSIAVSVGQSVAAGQFLGISDNTGGSTGSHLHLTLQDLEAGLDGYVINKVVNPLPWLEKFTAPSPPAGIDLLPYLKGDGRLYEVRNANGGQERHQTQVGGNSFYQTKNVNWEQLWETADYIYRDIDTSPGNDRYYRLKEGNSFGSRWIPRNWHVGGIFTRDRFVQFYTADCKADPNNSGPVTDTMRFVAKHASYTFKTGFVLPDVVELEWVNGPERYFYARNYGLVGWQRLHGDPNTPEWSAISEEHAPGARPDNLRKVIDCL